MLVIVIAKVRDMTYRVASVVDNGKEAGNLASRSGLDESNGADTESRSVGRNTAKDIAALSLELLYTDLGGLGGAVEGTRGDVVAGSGSGADGGGGSQDGGNDGELHIGGCWFMNSKDE